LIYFIEADACKAIKIGYSRSDPNERLAILQTGSPAKLTRLALMAGSLSDEYKLHERFKALRSHGEWFRDEPELRDFIQEHAVPWVDWAHIQFRETPTKPERPPEPEPVLEPLPRQSPSEAEQAYADYLRAAVNRIRPSLPPGIESSASWRSSDLMLARDRRKTSK
jgi:hypothetical protein